MGGDVPTRSHVQGSHSGFAQGNARDATCPWTREPPVRSCHQWPRPNSPSQLSSISHPLPPSPPRPPTPTTHPPLLFFFKNCPVPTHGSSRSVQGENKTKYKLKSQNTKRIACFASRKLLALSPETSSHTQIIASRSRRPIWGRGRQPVSLTAPGRRCPAGQRSGPPSRSPPAAAPWGQSQGAAWQNVAAAVWRWGGGPRPC